MRWEFQADGQSFGHEIDGVIGQVELDLALFLPVVDIPFDRLLFRLALQPSDYAE